MVLDGTSTVAIIKGIQLCPPPPPPPVLGCADSGTGMRELTAVLDFCTKTPDCERK